MNKNEMDQHTRELRFEYLKHGLLIFIWVCFLIYQIVRISNNPPLYGKTVWPTVFSFAVLIILIAIAGAKLYRQSASYIRWYEGILDSIPVAIIATDKDATWRQANKMACATVNVRQGHSIEELSSRHLIGTDGDVIEKKWMQGTTEYRVAGNPLCVGGKDVGHILLFYNMSELTGPSGTRTELIGEVNSLLAKLSVASAHFDGYARSLAGYTMRQAGIIHELSDVIVGIASGAINEPNELNQKMGIIKSQMQQQEESSQLQIDKMRKTTLELASTHNLINNVLRNINSVP